MLLKWKIRTFSDMFIANSSVEWIIYYFVPFFEKKKMAQSPSMCICIFNIFMACALKIHDYSLEKRIILKWIDCYKGKHHVFGGDTATMSVKLCVVWKVVNEGFHCMFMFLTMSLPPCKFSQLLYASGRIETLVLHCNHHQIMVEDTIKTSQKSWDHKWTQYFNIWISFFNL